MRNPILILMYLSSLTLVCCGQSEKKGSKDAAADTVRTKSRELALPEPNATKSVMNFSEVIGWEGNMPKAPAGFQVMKFADGLENPRWIYVLPNGDILVAETKKMEKPVEKVVTKVSGMKKAHGKSDVVNRIALFRDTNNDGTPDLHTTFLSGVTMPFGMALIRNDFYVAANDAVWIFPYRDGDTVITSSGKKIADLPVNGRHWTRNIVANQTGSKIYVAVGSGSDHAEDGIDKESRRACILEFNPDGTGERLYASGLRNPVGMDWQPGTQVLWTAVNERDGLGDDLPPDYITSVQDGGFYGWPYSYYGQHRDPRIKADEQRPDLVAKALIPDVPLGTHTASLGLCFYDGKMFPEHYQNGVFVGQHGSWNRSVLSGYKVVFVPFENGRPGKAEDFLTGFIADESKSKVHGRPVGVTVLQDGSLLVADDASNTLWRISYGK